MDEDRSEIRELACEFSVACENAASNRDRRDSFISSSM